MKKKLLFVLNLSSYFLSHRLPIAQAAEKLGYEIHVAAPLDEQAEKITKLGFNFHPIFLSRKGTSPFAELRSIWVLFKLYRSLKPDLVHHLTIKPVLYGTIAARFMKVPMIVNAITGLGYIFAANDIRVRLLKIFIKFMYRIILLHSNSILIFQNEDDRKIFLNSKIVFSTKAVLIRSSGVDLEKFKPNPTFSLDSSPIVLLVSRMLWLKGVGNFVEAARTLKLRFKNARFVLVGDTDKDNPSGIPFKQLKDWDDQGIVEWWQYRANMPEVYTKSTIMCLPSLYAEGVPKVLIEAAASGLPIITTDTPGCRDVVQNNFNGFLIPKGDTQALIIAIENLLRAPELCAMMGARGRKVAETNFSVKKVINETMAIYQNQLDKIQHTSLQTP